MQRPRILVFGFTMACTSFQVQPNLPFANHSPPQTKMHATLVPLGIRSIGPGPSTLPSVSGNRRLC